MKILAEIHRAKGIRLQGRTIYRAAVRAVILRGRDLLMIYSANAGDYKLPGGGVREDETHEQALIREVKEECGATLTRVEREIGAIIEYDFAEEEEFDVFKMTSHYYPCEVEENFGSQALEDYEKKLGFQPAWVDIDKAIAKNKSLLNSTRPPEWLRRELFMLEYLHRSAF